MAGAGRPGRGGDDDPFARDRRVAGALLPAEECTTVAPRGPILEDSTVEEIRQPLGQHLGRADGRGGTIEQLQREPVAL